MIAVAPFWTRPRKVALALSAAVLGVFIAANVHLIYLSFASRPGCVAHLKAPDSGSATNGNATYIAASSSC